VEFSLTDEEFSELGAAAAQAGLSRGAYATEAALAAARGGPSRAGVLLREALVELMSAAGLARRAGTNLNQAVARLNATGQRGEDLVPATQFCMRGSGDWTRLRSICAGAFRDQMRILQVIAKVLRGTNARRLLHYLYGPGRANEHTDPHLVAGFSDPVELEPERRRGGSLDLRRLAGLLAQPLAGLLAQPLAALGSRAGDKPVWHCSVRAAPGDRLLSDGEWARVAPQGDDLAVRWVVVRHAADHVHIVATLARQDGGKPSTWNDFCRVREACQDAERRFGLRCTAPADRTAARRATRAETEQAARRGWREAPRAALRREVCTAGCWSGCGTAPPIRGR
jgi:hypothetical protein